MKKIPRLCPSHGVLVTYVHLSRRGIIACCCLCMAHLPEVGR